MHVQKACQKSTLCGHGKPKSLRILRVVKFDETVWKPTPGTTYAVFCLEADAALRSWRTRAADDIPGAPMHIRSRFIDDNELANLEPARRGVLARNIGDARLALGPKLCFVPIKDLPMPRDIRLVLVLVLPTEGLLLIVGMLGGTDGWLNHLIHEVTAVLH